MNHFKVIFYFFILLSVCYCQRNKCATKESCGACIRDPDCVWCNSPFQENTEFQRCELYAKSNNRHWCPAEYIINPQSEHEILHNIPLQSSTIHGKDAVQISPQKIKIKLRAGQEHEFKFKYATAEDYPVDLYYIMDLSASMLKHKNKLSGLGILLSETMHELTKNFKLGFGSFIDKPVTPYVGTHPKILENPCLQITNMHCAPAYSFINHLPLTENSQEFTNKVAAADVSGNIDFPEGGLDALMQAIVCKKEIGWRPKARHLIVFSTDASFHIAGDGKLGGIVQPNDGKCHMKNNTYTHGTLLDYPSIGQIAHTVKENNINIIFAIANSKSESVISSYKILRNRIEGSSLGFLNADSSNVVHLVSNIYNEIMESVKITDNAPSNIEIKYFSSCHGFKEIETNECKNLQIGDTVEFKAVLKLLNCPENTHKQVFEIKPSALHETLLIEVDLICECDCEKNNIPNALECSNSGSLQCGVCNCPSGKFGSKCECDGVNITKTEILSNCRISNASEICSGLGTCKCNRCSCQERINKDEKIYGRFCECTNYSCQRIAGALCSNNGVCDCGKCICNAGFEGVACQCRNRNDTCVSSNGDICNGHGTCVCGSCVCEDSFYGQLCQECPSCEGQLCSEIKDCVECRVHKTGIYDTEVKCTDHCSTLHIDVIDDFEMEVGFNEKLCRGADNQSCIFNYKYYYDEVTKGLKIFASKEKICPDEINILAIVGGIIGSILLAGLILLLLWKGITTVHDRREYAKFENERKNAVFDRGENPLFRHPVTTFNNPSFKHDY